MQKSQRAFTLIELSIVLVVIGLIVGGVLVGRDLIEASRVRAQATQLQMFSAAVNAFKSKYDALPGDMLSADAQRFGLYYSVALGSPMGVPNNNGILDNSYYPGQLIYTNTHEQFLFWTNLKHLGFIEDRIVCYYICFRNGVDYYSGVQPAYPDTVGTVLPAMKYSPKYGIIPVMIPPLGSHYWSLGMKSYLYSLEHATAIEPSLTPAQAMKLDQKIDDGVPSAGIARILKFPSGVDSGGTPYTGYNIVSDDNISQGSYSPANCVSNAGATYNTANTAVVCKMFVRFE